MENASAITVIESTKNEVRAINDAVIQAKENFQIAWVDLALKLLDLTAKMKRVGDHKPYWRTYLGCENFEDYCESKLNLSHATCYQLIASLRFINKYRPELLKAHLKDQGSVEIPSYTKIRLIKAAKKKLDKKLNSDDALAKTNAFIDLSIKPSTSVRELDAEIKTITGGPKPIDEYKQKLRKFIASGKDSLMPAVIDKNYQATQLWMNELNDLAHGEDCTRVQNPRIRRLIVASSVRKDRYTKKILNRVREIDPTIDTVYIGVKELLDEDDDRDEEGHKILFPSQMNGGAKYWYSKESLVLRDRGSSSFIETFPSPGTIVENLGTVLKLGFHCRSICNYCYLQGGKYPWQELYINLERVKSELEVEAYVHTSLLTVWSAYSFYHKKATDKVPPAFDKMGNQLLRKAFNRQHINSEEEAIEYLQDNLNKLLTKLKVNVDERKLARIIKGIPTYYERNKKSSLMLNVGEYTDIIASEPISHHMKSIFDDIIDKYNNYNVSIWTKSVHFDEILKHNGKGRVFFTIGINTKHIIEKYETGTASLDERIEGIKKLQAGKGYKIRLNLEPIIKYDGCEQEYVDIIHYVMKRIDPDQITGLTMGTTRLRTDMVWKIRRNHPTSDLLNNMEEFDEYDLDDKRLRYDYDFRISIYRKLIKAFREYSDKPITLGAEVPEIWKEIGLDKKSYMKNQVYQYGDDGEKDQ